jgi:hypothetical protein
MVSAIYRPTFGPLTDSTASTYRLPSIFSLRQGPAAQKLGIAACRWSASLPLPAIAPVLTCVLHVEIGPAI